MRASKTVLLSLHRGFDKIKQGGRVMVLDKKAAEKLYNQLRLIESDEGTYKIAFENEMLYHLEIDGQHLMYILESLVRNLLRKWVLMWINLKVVQKVRFPRRE